ncbi:MAG TPA: ATP-binding protein [Anaerolineales bacterium]|nr:ATP-binding protein [Anaerolineales bacterium]
MTERIDETLKKIAAATSTTSTPTSSSTESAAKRRQAGLLGDPECPHCSGLGYLRLDLPLDHADFGKLQPCTCRHSQISQQVHRRLFSLSNLEELRHLTFENFQSRGRIGLGPAQANTLERAFNSARQFSQHLSGWLLLEGPIGCGKTHLAAAIANFAVSVGVPTLFLTVPDLLDNLRFSYGDPEASYEERFEEIRRVQLLILDDFGTQNATAWAQEKLFQILNYRYINRLPTVVTTNLYMEEIEGRIASRLHDPELVTRVHFEATDFRDPTEEVGYQDLSSLPLLHDRTFGNFSDRSGEGLTASEVQSLEKAFQAAYRFAEEPSGWLVLSGPYGCGKTHLAAAIANYRTSQGFPVMFATVPELLDHLRATFNPESPVRLDRRFNEFKNAPLLILDDLGTQTSTRWAKEKLDMLLNHRYIAELPTVITTVERIDEIDPRIRSRMLDKRLCTVFPITAPAYTGGRRREAKTIKKTRR